MAALQDVDLSASPARLATERRSDAFIVRASGAWVLGAAERHDEPLRKLAFTGVPRLEIDCAGLERLDTTGAWLLMRTKRMAEMAGAQVAWRAVPDAFQPLISTIDHECRRPPVEHPDQASLRFFLERLGRAQMAFFAQAVSLLGFIGMVATETVATVFNPRRLRVPALVHQMEEVGLNALPIVGLLSFLLGIVFAFQGADQLRRFGAEIFTVNLLGISILREIGAIMTAIIVAGRSGSSFTAQIGTMKVNEEIDALYTLGMNPVEVLVLPRMLALVLTLPLLTVYANIIGILGGALMCQFDLGITFPAFLRQLQGAVGTGWTFWIGIIKAPIFAFLIATVGCYEGLQVERNAASVGMLTTRSVVESIFLVIVADALFSILFSLLEV
ncbi:ABC transporter inner membrane subunit [Aliidongia dinghuensis]|uniref:ABC transporter inner membrane subunit n=1 Tax=Aliidongia dinghuensis TaxID=1867774 RepID=A0A8J2YPX9_9PROT|nr:MlaE family lipid ABC transporter permease subunit [Aliidongia dinghuensis]GGF03342.1 ABC transporter inner membrane subunit [Aliidongia dinghuensis]